MFTLHRFMPVPEWLVFCRGCKSTKSVVCSVSDKVTKMDIALFAAFIIVLGLQAESKSSFVLPWSCRVQAARSFLKGFVHTWVPIAWSVTSLARTLCCGWTAVLVLIWQLASLVQFRSKSQKSETLTHVNVVCCTWTCRQPRINMCEEQKACEHWEQWALYKQCSWHDQPHQFHRVGVGVRLYVNFVSFLSETSIYPSIDAQIDSSRSFKCKQSAYKEVPSLLSWRTGNFPLRAELSLHKLVQRNLCRVLCHFQCSVGVKASKNTRSA